MPKPVRIAYLLVFFGLIVVGFLLDLAWWVSALAGVAATLPIAIADVVTTRRRPRSTVQDATDRAATG
jgi:uncharacterized protein YqfA (UPF0365 family)